MATVISVAKTIGHAKSALPDVCASDADRIRWILPNLRQNADVVSVANGVIYLGTWTPFDTSTSPHNLLVIADTDVLPPASFVCSYPSIPTDSCAPRQDSKTWVC